MKLDNHIAMHLLTNPELARKVVEQSIPKMDDQRKADTISHLHPYGQKAYYITDTVLDKLDMLKVRRDVEVDIRMQDSTATLGEARTFNWRVFNTFKPAKLTFILPDNIVVRIVSNSKVLWFCFIHVNKVDGIDVEIVWTFFYYDKVADTVSQNWMDKEVMEREEFVYKLLCFFYLAENEEVIVEAGQRYGTRKQGKIINSLPVPITIVNSKWNVTSIRTEGFPVSGHFRLQPTRNGHKMIFIDPYQKHGYVRRAKKDTEV